MFGHVQSCSVAVVIFGAVEVPYAFSAFWLQSIGGKNTGPPLTISGTRKHGILADASMPLPKPPTKTRLLLPMGVDCGGCGGEGGLMHTHMHAMDAPVHACRWMDGDGLVHPVKG